MFLPRKVLDVVNLGGIALIHTKENGVCARSELKNGASSPAYFILLVCAFFCALFPNHYERGSSGERYQRGLGLVLP